MPASIDQLQNEYYEATRFSESLRDEIEELLKGNKISLGVPIELRVKKLDSILEKIERKTLSIESVTDLPDLIGLRLILLFNRDVVKACDLISTTFNVLQKEDTQERLDESQFGYQSFHYLIQLPKNWLSVPSLASVGQFKAEIQIRTVAQHIWAAASHVLQYKQESNVPLPVKRSIYRVSALRAKHPRRQRDPPKSADYGEQYLGSNGPQRIGTRTRSRATQMRQREAHKEKDRLGARNIVV